MKEQVWISDAGLKKGPGDHTAYANVYFLFEHVASRACVVGLIRNSRGCLADNTDTPPCNWIGH
jgi:hypothetical protein